MRSSLLIGWLLASTAVAACAAPTPPRPAPAVHVPPSGVAADCAAAVSGEPDPQAGSPAAGPLVITEGGTYRGNWRSDDPTVPVVLVRTTEPVVIESSRMTGRGALVSGETGVDLTVRNSLGTAENPGRPGLVPGRFVDLRDAANVVVENNMLVGTSGIRLEGVTRSSGEGTFRVVGNRARNIDGRRSTGSGFSTDDRTAEYVQFVQLVSVPGVASIDIGWNDVHNDPGHSRVEDVISVFLSSGTRESPITVHDNFIDGAYPTNPELDSTYSGGGIMLGDGDQPGVRNVLGVGNVVANTTNYGMAVSSGVDIEMSGNTVLAVGRLRDGSAIPAQNVGIYVYNLYEQSEFGPVVVEDNVVGWQSGKSSERNDYYTPDVSVFERNQEFAGMVSRAEISRQREAWSCRARDAGIRVGP